MQTKRFINFCLNDVWPVVLIFAIIGGMTSYHFKLTMDREAWFWFFSSLMQAFAALVALVAVFLIFRLDLFNTQISDKTNLIRNLIGEFIPDEKNHYQDYFRSQEILLETIPMIENRLNSNNRGQLILITHEEILHLERVKKQAINLMKLLLQKNVLLIGLSIILLPLGSLDTENNMMIDFWINFKIKWFLIFGFIGFSIVSLYNISIALGAFLSKKK